MSELVPRPPSALAKADLAARSLLRSTPRPSGDRTTRSPHQQDGGRYRNGATGPSGSDGTEHDVADDPGEAAGTAGHESPAKTDPNDLSATVTVDPRLTTRVRVSDVRLLKGHTFRSGKRILACEHKFSITLHSSERHWPSGTLRLDTYDDNGLRVRTVKLNAEPTSDPARRIVAQDVQTSSPISRAELVFEETNAADEVRKDLSDAVELDPRITVAGMTVDAVRLVRETDPDSSYHRYEFTATLARTGRLWPDGTFLLMPYDRRGRPMGSVATKQTNSVHARRRTVSVFYSDSKFSVSEPIGRAELLFEPTHAGTLAEDVDDGWGRVVTEADASAAAAAGVTVESLVTECKATAGSVDLVALEVRGRVASVNGGVLVGDLCAQITVYDDADKIVATENAELGNAKLPARSFAYTLTCYRRLDPALVKVEFYLA